MKEEYKSTVWLNKQSKKLFGEEMIPATHSPIFFLGWLVATLYVLVMIPTSILLLLRGEASAALMIFPLVLAWFVITAGANEYYRTPV